MRRLPLLIAALVVSLVAPAAALGAWSAPLPIHNSGLGDVSNPLIGTGDNGDAIALFQQINPNAAVGSEQDVPFPYLTRLDNNGAKWSVPLRVGAPPINEGGDDIFRADLAVAPNGFSGFSFPFFENNGNSTTSPKKTVTQAFGGVWPVTPGSATADNPSPPSVPASNLNPPVLFHDDVSDAKAVSQTDAAADAAGNVYVVTRKPSPATCADPINPNNCVPDPNNPDGRLFVTKFEAGGGFSRSDTGLDGRDPKIAVSRDGKTVALAYVRHVTDPSDPGSNTAVNDVIHGARGSFGGSYTQKALSAARAKVGLGDHALAIDVNSSITFLYAMQPEDTPPGAPSLRRVIYGQIWAAGAADPVSRADLSKNGGGADVARSPRVAADDAGNVTAVWTLNKESVNQIYASELSNGSWKSATQVSPSNANLPGDAPGVDSNTAQAVAALTVENGGTATILFPDKRNGSRFDVWASRRDRGGAWSAPVRISSDKESDGATNLHVSGHANGETDAVWQQGAKKILAARFSSGGSGPTPQPPGIKDTKAPDASVSSPSLSTEEGPTETFTVKFDAKDEGGGAVKTRLQFRDLSRAASRKKKGKKTAVAFKTIPVAKIGGQSQFRFKGVRGHTYQFQFTATDEAGNRSAPKRTTTIVPVDERSGGPTFRGNWFDAKQKPAFRGRFKVSSQRGATMSFGFTGGDIAIVAPTGPSGGKALVTLDGKKKVVDFFSAKGVDRVIVFRAASAVRRHRLVLTVLHRKSRKATNFKVAIDAIAVANRRS